MIRPLVIFPDERLTSVSKYVNRFDRELHDLVSDLFQTMYSSDGVGLAAVQIGVLRRIFVMDVREKNEPHNPVAFINPVLLVKTGTEVDQEGCLSLPGVFLDVRRATSVVVASQTLDGTHFSHAYRGLEARVVQHEMDHLSGILFTARAANETMAAAQ
jgi:peptide deformylase